MSDKMGKEEVEAESYFLSDIGLASVGEGFTKLERLSLIWCSSVTSAGLRSVAKNCRGLKALDLQVSTYFHEIDVFFSYRLLRIPHWLVGEQINSL